MESDPQAKSEIDFFCGNCGGPITSSPDKTGEQVNCPECKASNKVPGASAKAETESKPTERAEIFKFFCVCCGQKLSSPIEFAGKSFECPNCAHTNVVPGEPKPAPPAPVSSDLIRFFCNGCGQKLSCEPGLAGQTIDCPVCDAATRVPAPAAPTGGGAPAMPVPVRPPKPAAKVVPPPARLEKPETPTPQAEEKPAPKAAPEPAAGGEKSPALKVPKPVPLQRPVPPSKSSPEVPESRTPGGERPQDKREEAEAPGDAKVVETEAKSLPKPSPVTAEPKPVAKKPVPMRKPEPVVPVQSEPESKVSRDEQKKESPPEQPRREAALPTPPPTPEQPPDSVGERSGESATRTVSKPAAEESPASAAAPAERTRPADSDVAASVVEKKAPSQEDAPPRSDAPVKAKVPEKPKGVPPVDLPPAAMPQPRIPKPASTAGEKTVRKPKGVPSIDLPPAGMQLPAVEPTKAVPGAEVKRTTKPKGVPKIDLPPSEPRLPASPVKSGEENTSGQPELDLEVRADAPTRQRRPLVVREVTVNPEKRQVAGKAAPSAKGATTAPADPQAELPLTGEKNPDERYGEAAAVGGGEKKPNRGRSRPEPRMPAPGPGSPATGAPQQADRVPRKETERSGPGTAGKASAPPNSAPPAPEAPAMPPAKKKSRLARIFSRATRNVVPSGEHTPEAGEQAGAESASAVPHPGKPASLPGARKGTPPPSLAEPGAGAPIPLRPRNVPSGDKPEVAGRRPEVQPAASQPIRINRPETGKKRRLKVANTRQPDDHAEGSGEVSEEAAAQNTETLRKRTVLPPRKDGPVSRGVRGPGPSGQRPDSAK